MKKIGVFLFLITLAVGLVIANVVSFGRMSSSLFNFSFNVGSVKGSGNTASELRDVSGFGALDVAGVFEVEITAQKDFAVEVEADDNLLPLIKTEVRHGILRIKTERKLRSENPIRIRISAPDIDNLDVSGAASVTLTDLDNAQLNIDSSGAAKVLVAGKTYDLNVDASGATRVNAESLKTQNAGVDASGASQVTVTVSGDLKAKASGASRVAYGGKPANVVKKTSGASTVVQQ